MNFYCVQKYTFKQNIGLIKSHFQKNKFFLKISKKIIFIM